jgi:hypothetical protein
VPPSQCWFVSEPSQDGAARRTCRYWVATNDTMFSAAVIASEMQRLTMRFRVSIPPNGIPLRQSTESDIKCVEIIIKHAANVIDRMASQLRQAPIQFLCALSSATSAPSRRQVCPCVPPTSLRRRALVPPWPCRHRPTGTGTVRDDRPAQGSDLTSPFVVIRSVHVRFAWDACERDRAWAETCVVALTWRTVQSSVNPSSKV